MLELGSFAASHTQHRLDAPTGKFCSLTYSAPLGCSNWEVLQAHILNSTGPEFDDDAPNNF